MELAKPTILQSPFRMLATKSVQNYLKCDVERSFGTRGTNKFIRRCASVKDRPNAACLSNGFRSCCSRFMASRTQSLNSLV